MIYLFYLLSVLSPYLFHTFGTAGTTYSAKGVPNPNWRVCRPDMSARTDKCVSLAGLVPDILFINIL